MRAIKAQAMIEVSQVKFTILLFVDNRTIIK